jgi:hypothetical protein
MRQERYRRARTPTAWKPRRYSSVNIAVAAAVPVSVGVSVVVVRRSTTTMIARIKFS